MNFGLCGVCYRDQSDAAAMYRAHTGATALSPRRHATVDDEFCPGHVARVVAGEIENTSSDILRKPLLADWDNLLRHLVKVRRIRTGLLAGAGNCAGNDAEPDRCFDDARMNR